MSVKKDERSRCGIEGEKEGGVGGLIEQEGLAAGLVE